MSPNAKTPTATTTDLVEVRAAEIVAGWDAVELGRKMERARRLARQETNNEERARHDAIPANWAQRMALAGVTSVSLTWPGAPVDPDLCLPRSRWSIDPDGVWFTPEDHNRQFVMSPAVDGPAPHEYSALAGKDWFTVQVVPPAGRIPPHAYVKLVLERLSKAGVTFGAAIDQSSRDVPDEVPSTHFAAVWLLGVTLDGSIVGRPTRTLAATLDEHQTETTYPDAAAGREQLGRVLTRLPADVRGPRR